MDDDRAGMDRNSRGFDTLAVHAGAEPDAETGAVSPPIYQTSTFAQEGVGRPRNGWEYARTGNPTRARLERAVAQLEGAAYGIAFSSGAAATAMIAELAMPGDEVVIGDDVYGGTYRLFERVLREKGIDARYVNLDGEPASVTAALSPRTRLVWFETPTNPLLKLVDIRAVADAVGAYAGRTQGGRTQLDETDADPSPRPLIVVDNTFASPALQQPLSLGADIVFHSATKYLAGHSDTVSGIVATNDEAVATRLRFLQNAIGAVPGPMDCFLVLRGMRTLGLRMRRHCENARLVAEFLASRDDVAAIRYPGLASGRHAHRQSGLAARQMRGAGGMVSFEPAAVGSRTARERAVAICEATSLFTLGESLGGVESLIELPAVMTHASVAGSTLEVPEALVRLSVGIEDPDDLIEDLRRALDGA